MPLPQRHKKTFLIAIICAMVVFSVSAYSGIFSKKLPPKNIASVTAKTTENSNQAAVANNEDWQKIFLNNSTSTKELSFAEQVKMLKDVDEGTITARFGKKFLEQYLNLKKAGLTDNAGAINSLGESLLSDDFLITDTPVTYTSKNIVIDPRDDKDSLTRYGNAVGNIMKIHVPKRNDAYILFEALKNETDYKKELKGNVAAYKKIIESLKKTPVPKSISQFHLDLINGVSNLSYISASLIEADSDPLRSTVSLGLYEKSASSLFSAVQGIKTAMIDAGVNFSKNDPGSYFNLSQL